MGFGTFRFTATPGYKAPCKNTSCTAKKATADINMSFFAIVRQRDMSAITSGTSSPQKFVHLSTRVFLARIPSANKTP